MVRNSDDERCTCYSNEGRPSSEKKQDRPPGGLLKGWQLTGRGPKALFEGHRRRLSKILCWSRDFGIWANSGNSLLVLML
jgi:hypothetical protein